MEKNRNLGNLHVTWFFHCTIQNDKRVGSRMGSLNMLIKVQNKITSIQQFMNSSTHITLYASANFCHLQKYAENY